MGDLYNQEHDITEGATTPTAQTGFQINLLTIASLVARRQESGSQQESSAIEERIRNLLQQLTIVEVDASVKPPASEDTLQNLPKVYLPTTSSGTRPTCPICTDDFEPDVKACRLPCGHSFHTDCIFPWLRRTCTCPLCREELPTDDASYEHHKKMEKRRAGANAMYDQMFN